MRYALERKFDNLEGRGRHPADTVVVDTQAQRPCDRAVCRVTWVNATVIAQALNAVHDGSRYSGNDIVQRMDAPLLRSSETNGG